MNNSQHQHKFTPGLDHRQRCEDGPLHPQALAGLRYFNQGAYFEAHEALESAWRVESGSSRDLYRGILQVAVMYHHIMRNNFNGAIKMFQRCMPWLLPFPDFCHGVDVAALRADCLNVYNELARLGPRNMADFNRALLLPIKYSDSTNKD